MKRTNNNQQEAQEPRLIDALLGNGGSGASDTVKADYKEIVGEVFSGKDRNRKAFLNSRQIAALGLASVFAERYDSDVMRAFIVQMLDMSMSQSGVGIGTLRDVLSTAALLNSERRVNETLTKKLLGA